MGGTERFQYKILLNPPLTREDLKLRPLCHRHCPENVRRNTAARFLSGLTHWFDGDISNP